MNPATFICTDENYINEKLKSRGLSPTQIKDVKQLFMHNSTTENSQESTGKTLENQQPVTGNLPDKHRENTGKTLESLRIEFSEFMEIALSNTKKNETIERINKRKELFEVAYNKADENECDKLVRLMQRTITRQNNMKEEINLYNTSPTPDDYLDKYKPVIKILEDKKLKKEIKNYGLNQLVKFIKSRGVKCTPAIIKCIDKATEAKKKKQIKKVAILSLSTIILLSAFSFFVYVNYFYEVPTQTSQLQTTETKAQTTENKVIKIKPIFYPALKKWKAQGIKISKEVEKKLKENYLQLVNEKAANGIQLEESELIKLFAEWKSGQQ